jgi:hypothetical protein
MAVSANQFHDVSKFDVLVERVKDKSAPTIVIRRAVDGKVLEVLAACQPSIPEIAYTTGAF